MGKNFYMGQNTPIEKIIGAPKMQEVPKITIPDEADIKRKQEVLDKAFAEFVKDESYFGEYTPYGIIGSKVLLRLFLYVPPAESGLMDVDGNPIEHSESAGKLRVTSFAKVIKVGDDVTKPFDTIKAGDIVTLPDDITGSRINPAWLDYMEASKERPGPTSAPPQQFIGNISTYKEYVFIGNKLRPTHDKMDAFTFLVPQSKIVSIWKG